MLPFSEPGGSVGTSRLTVPSSDEAGHSMPSTELWILAWAGVQAVSPAAADGFSVMPSGSLIVAVLSWELSIFVGSWLIPTSKLNPSGSSLAVVAAFSEKLGSNGTRLQLLRASSVVYGLRTTSRFE